MSLESKKSKLLQKLKTDDYSEKELRLVREALKFGEKAHEKQLRFSGEPYFSHPLEVALSLSKMQTGCASIAAALLHDVPEDTPYTLKNIQSKFGREIAFLVDGVTKISKIRLKKGWFGLGRVTKEKIPLLERQTETLRKMILATSKDLRIVIIKLADRLHNMKTLQYVPANKQLRIAQETLDIYAVIAERLGIGSWKGELEDLAFPFLFPDAYDFTKKLAGKELKKRKNDTLKLKKYLYKFLVKEKIKVIDIHGRVKHLYSLWRKLQRYDYDISNIYDLVAMRIILYTVKDCYHAISIVHKHWKPIPGRIKDYIAQPKANGYRSLHSTVKGLGGSSVEIQIRTAEMHHQAEEGVATHWSYKGREKETENRFKPYRLPKKQLIWLKELLKWQKNIRDTNELNRSLKFDFFKDRIFVYTPQGDVKDLPENSSPIDFAYAVHTEVGHSYAGAKVNNRIVPIDYKLKNGDVVEILTSKKKSGPKHDWLNVAKSAQARSSIRNYLRKSK